MRNDVNFELVARLRLRARVVARAGSGPVSV